MDNIKLTQIGGPYGDACSRYSFTTTKEHFTIQDLIGAARRNTPEWGYVRVNCGCDRFELEYSHGQIISNNIPESLYDKEFTEGTAYGGWSRMDYEVTITPDNHGGKRPGAGRPRKGEELRIPITFSVDPKVKVMVAELRNAGVDVGQLVCSVIAMKYEGMFGEHDTGKMDAATRKYTATKKGCGIEFPFFGASYPDAKCIDGYLWDMDSYENGLYTIGGDDPCPFCNTEEWVKLALDNEEFDSREEAIAWVEKMREKYK